jgi:hypothetical protein
VLAGRQNPKLEAFHEGLFHADAAVEVRRGGAFVLDLQGLRALREMDRSFLLVERVDAVDPTRGTHLAVNKGAAQPTMAVSSHVVLAQLVAEARL